MAKNIMKLEDKNRSSSSQETKKTTARKPRLKVDQNQTLLTKYVVTKPRASLSAPSKEVVTIKEGSSSTSEGRGEGEGKKERNGGTQPQEKWLGASSGHQETRPSTERARLELAKSEEGPQDSKEGREGVKDASRKQGRPTDHRYERGLETEELKEK